MIISKKHAVVLHKPIAFLLTGFLLTPAASLLAATQAGSADKAGKEDTLAPGLCHFSLDVGQRYRLGD
jgi:hypothetical protein